MSTLASVSSRTDAISDSAALEFAAEVRSGLCRPGQKELHSKYFYDELGSALFEAITFLPEYGLTRADARLLFQHANDLIRLAEQPSVIAELGSGTGAKTRLVLQALQEPDQVTYCPIDISASALAKCELELGRCSTVKIQPIEDSYLTGLA